MNYVVNVQLDTYRHKSILVIIDCIAVNLLQSQIDERSSVICERSLRKKKISLLPLSYIPEVDAHHIRGKKKEALTYKLAGWHFGQVYCLLRQIF